MACHVLCAIMLTTVFSRLFCKMDKKCRGKMQALLTGIQLQPNKEFLSTAQMKDNVKVFIEVSEQV